MFPRSRDVLIHLRTISTHDPHPEAKEPTIMSRLPLHLDGDTVSDLTIQFANDLLSLFFFSSPLLPRLLLWDWKTGTVILVS